MVRQHRNRLVKSLGHIPAEFFAKWKNKELAKRRRNGAQRAHPEIGVEGIIDFSVDFDSQPRSVPAKPTHRSIHSDSSLLSPCPREVFQELHVSADDIPSLTSCTQLTSQCTSPGSGSFQATPHLPPDGAYLSSPASSPPRHHTILDVAVVGGRTPAPFPLPSKLRNQPLRAPSYVPNQPLPCQSQLYRETQTKCDDQSCQDQSYLYSESRSSCDDQPYLPSTIENLVDACNPFSSPLAHSSQSSPQWDYRYLFAETANASPSFTVVTESEEWIQTYTLPSNVLVETTETIYSVPTFPSPSPNLHSSKSEEGLVDTEAVNPLLRSQQPGWLQLSPYSYPGSERLQFLMYNSALTDNSPLVL